MYRLIIKTILLISLFPLAAQSNEMMDSFLAKEEADLGTSAYLVLAASGQISPEAGIDDALSWIESEGLDSKFSSLDPERPVSYGEFSFLIMKGFNLSGGIMYTLIPGPRYAAREISYRKWILGSSIPGRAVKPFEALNALALLAEEEL